MGPQFTLQYVASCDTFANEYVASVCEGICVNNNLGSNQEIYTLVEVSRCFVDEMLNFVGFTFASIC